MPPEHVEALIKKGVMRPTLQNEVRIYHYCKQRRREVSLSEAVFEASEKFFKSEITIWRILKRLGNV